ncbi:uncharacterized protein LOC116163134 [Photinus pyralis]|uniref:uncharacterized protein LOC116163134 n=1 Tax=Photinus pyralis TaxID=7054 RepID=UPI00126776D1|nr:uncharacterized protein LOC116163134 [Photinus pyralis]
MERVQKIEDVNERGQEARNLIISCIRHHNVLLNSCKELNSIIKDFMLWRIVTGSGAICVTAFMIRFQVNLFHGACYFTAIMLECFVYAYVGNDVVFASSNFADVVFTAGWHLLDLPQNVDIQEMCRFMIFRAQKSVKMTVGDFGHLTLEFYMKMVKFSFSIYTVMGKRYNK